MLSFLADVMGVATRQERWSGPDHWKATHGHKSAWEIERDLAEARAKEMRRPGMF